MTKQKVNPLLIRRQPGERSRFELDPELVEFLNRVDRYYTIKQLRGLMLERFGSERTPSKSSLHRYLQKLNRQTQQANGGQQ